MRIAAQSWVESEILHHSTEQDLIDNWAGIIYDMNREMERLGNYPLTSSEMQQIIDQVNMCGSPYKVNKFITEHAIFDIQAINDNWATPLMEERRLLKNWLPRL